MTADPTVFVVDDLPRTSTGKVKKKELVEERDEKTQESA